MNVYAFRWVVIVVALTAGMAFVTKEPPAVMGAARPLYDLSTIQAPVLSGFPLRVFVTLLETWPFSSILLSKIKADSDFHIVRQFAGTLDLPPTMYPLGDVEENGGEVTTPKEYLDGSALSRPHGNGFRYWTVDDYANAYRSGRTNPKAVAESLVAALRAMDAQHLNIATQWREHDIRSQAAASAARFSSGKPLGIFDGVPVVVKEEFDVAGYRTTGGTTFLNANKNATADADCVARFRAAGAIILAKVNMHEIGIGVTGHNSHYGIPANPYNIKHYTGGSSSGSGAAVGAGLAPIGLSADGGGSIRIPASLCGAVGLKGTFGRFSEVGALPLCWSVAHAGPIAATVRDTALAYALLAGPDPRDHNSLHQPPVNLHGVDSFSDLTGIRLGIFRPYAEDADPAVVKIFNAMVEKLKSRGAVVKDIVMPNLQAISKSHSVVIVSEMAMSMDKYYPEHEGDFDLSTRANLVAGRSFSARDYVSANIIRTYAMNVLEKIYDEVDAIVTPTTGTAAPEVPASAIPDGESNLGLLSKIMRFAGLANFAGNPAVTVTAGYTDDNLPIGIQFMGRHWEEHVLLRMAAAVEDMVTRQRPQYWVDNLPLNVA